MLEVMVLSLLQGSQFDPELRFLSVCEVFQLCFIKKETILNCRSCRCDEEPLLLLSPVSDYG